MVHSCCFYPLDPGKAESGMKQDASSDVKEK